LRNEIGMIIQLHVYRAAKIFVKKHGPDLAPIMAAKRADAMLEYGDAEGQRMWTAVLRAVQDLTRTERDRGAG
jgi:hypothetical protein